MIKRISFLLLLSCLIASVAAPAFAVSWNKQETGGAVRLDTSLVNDITLDDLDLDYSISATTASVKIRNIRSGQYVYGAYALGNVLIIAQVTGTFWDVAWTVKSPTSPVSGDLTVIPRVGATDRFQVIWDTSPFPAAIYNVTIEALDSAGYVVGSASVNVNLVTAYRYALYYEIDYMRGHRPPAPVLTYMQNYWNGFAIQVTFKVDDVVTDPTPNDGRITDSDFWKIENQYNDVWKYDDRAHGNSTTGKYTLREKWMLYGTWAPNSTTGGYTWVINSSRDVLAGNYIFIADSMIDKWETTNTVPNEGGEEVVVLHEAGHSIGVEKLSSTYTEVYDTDYYSVMSKIRVQNAKSMAPYWYYSKEYWATANLSYYPIV